MLAGLAKAHVFKTAYNDRHKDQKGHPQERYIRDGRQKIPYITIQNLHTENSQDEVTHIVNILFSHGNDENIEIVSAGMQFILDVLNVQLNSAFREGCSKKLFALRIMAWEYPSYGRNLTEVTEETLQRQSVLSLNTLYESTWENLNKAKYEHRCITVSWGYSIGSVTACMAAKYTKPYVDIVFLEAPLKSALSSTGHKLAANLVNDVFNTVSDLLHREENYKDAQPPENILDVSATFDLKTEISREPRTLCIFAANDMEIPCAYSEFVSAHNNSPFANRLELIPSADHSYFITTECIERSTLILGNEILYLMSTPTNPEPPLSEFTVEISESIPDRNIHSVSQNESEGATEDETTGMLWSNLDDILLDAELENDQFNLDSNSLAGDAENQLSGTDTDTGSSTFSPSLFETSYLANNTRRDRVSKGLRKARGGFSEQSIILKLLTEKEG